MKKQLNVLDNLSDLQIKGLTSIVKETIAQEVIGINQQVFTSADLWNIQRNLKTRSQRRFL